MTLTDHTFEIAEYGDVEALIVKRWSKECESELLNKPRLLVFNQARGWRPEPVTFLAGLEVERLAILAHVPVAGLNTLASVRNLRALSLDCQPTELIAFQQMSELRSCWLSWSDEYGSVLRLPNLRVLGVSDFPGPDLRNLADLRGLEELTLKSGKLRSLSGLGALESKLRTLVLAGLSSLEEIEELASLAALERLSLEGCKKLRSIAVLRCLPSLVSLDLSDIGPVESLAPLRDLQKLEDLLFVASTDILDGDLSPLARLPKLRRVAFQGRAHYTHTCLLGLTKLVRKPWITKRRNPATA